MTSSPALAEEVRKRRTFAIISHPDAGKTTLTEKLLLYGGAINLAGSVKARRNQRSATSDWMELEKQRGISVTSSVLQFAYTPADPDGASRAPAGGYAVNLLDTPGHQDFSEDTYRTLAAVDSAVMLIDCAKGVETQTKKLFQVCRLRQVPIFTFVNKLDRQGREPLDLMDEIERVLGIRSCPLNWPIGMGRDFQGVLDRRTSRVHLFAGTDHGQRQGETRIVALDDPALPGILGEVAHRQLLDDLEMLDVAGDPFDLDRVLQGELAPMFFGSAMTNFGVQPFFDAFVELAPSPTPRMTADGPVDPTGARFSAFVFKIQANMNPAHRDCIAFLRVCSGTFEKGMEVRHVRTGRTIRLSKSHQFLAQDRSELEVAYPGDVVGLFDTGTLRIGDTLCEGPAFEFVGIPRFMPEHFARFRLKDPSKRKQLQKGLHQLSEEGAIQVFAKVRDEMDPVLGAVGLLQFDVLTSRLKSEYGVDIILENLPYSLARWVENDGLDPQVAARFNENAYLRDRDGKPLLLFRDEWSLNWELEKTPSLKLREYAI